MYCSDPYFTHIEKSISPHIDRSILSLLYYLYYNVSHFISLSFHIFRFLTFHLVFTIREWGAVNSGETVGAFSETKKRYNYCVWLKNLRKWKGRERGGERDWLLLLGLVWYQKKEMGIMVGKGRYFQKSPIQEYGKRATFASFVIV